MDATQLDQAVRAFVDDLNRGDSEAIQRHIAGDFFTYRPAPGEPTATEVWAELLGDLRAGLPDLRVEVNDLSPADGDRLAGSVTVTGTHSGTLWGAPPTGARIEWRPGVSVRAANGRLAVNFDDLSVPDLLGLLRTLELVNPPDQMHLPPKHTDSMVPEFVLRVAFNGQVAERPCSHLDAARVFDSDATECQPCAASGDTWPSLRLCMTCGFVGCCDTSVNTHMKRHAEETGHVLMRSIRLTEGWMWCYADNAFFDSRTLARLRARQAGT